MTGEPLLLGVDGGNTKTIAVLAGPDGTIRGVGRVDRQADMYFVGLEAALAVYREAAETAAIAAAVRNADVAAAAFSLAGADWPEDIALLRERLGAWWPSAVVVNDALGALRAAVPTGPGVVIVCGTGAATGARGVDGRTWHASFWQETQGAHELGVRALQAVYRAELGIDPATALTAGILGATGEPSVEALLHHASARGIAARRDPAVLARVLLDAADAGDATASEIVIRHGTSLAATGLAALRRVALDPTRDPFTLALAGGVFRHPARVFRAAVVDTIRASAPRVTVAEPALEPAAGALLLAFDAAGLPSGPDVRDRIAQGLGSGALFETHPDGAARS